MSRPLDLIRDADADEAFELLVFIAVATILAIRGFLALTGYPQLGGGGLHIAHMLWGGLFMLVAIALLLVFWNPAMRRIAAVVAGIGFGFFIDELGKFVTADNDYFFKPTAAVLYLLFLGLWGFARWLRSGIPLDAEEVRINDALRGMLAPPEAGVGELARAYFRGKDAIATAYARLTRRRGFARVLTAWFLFIALTNLVSVAGVVVDARLRGLGVWMLQGAGALLEGVFAWIGGWLLLRRRRLTAYRWFQRSLAVSLLVVQVGHFYTHQFWALTGVAVNVLLYLALTGMIEEEKARLAARAVRHREERRHDDHAALPRPPRRDGADRRGPLLRLDRRRPVRRGPAPGRAPRPSDSPRRLVGRLREPASRARSRPPRSSPAARPRARRRATACARSATATGRG